uniref:Putative secreted protein n=1 Tax=Anopheles darlingi TaxID=43151 RepID=A0A2M4D4R8_ANODA
MPFSLRMLLLLYADAADAVPCVLWVCMLHTRPSSCASPPGPSFTGSCPTPACCVATAQVCRSLARSLSRFSLIRGGVFGGGMLGDVPLSRGSAFHF